MSKPQYTTVEQLSSPCKPRPKTQSSSYKVTAKAIHSAPLQVSITMPFPMSQTHRFVAMSCQAMAA